MNSDEFVVFYCKQPIVSDFLISSTFYQLPHIAIENLSDITEWLQGNRKIHMVVCESELSQVDKSVIKKLENRVITLTFLYSDTRQLAGISSFIDSNFIDVKQPIRQTKKSLVSIFNGANFKVKFDDPAIENSYEFNDIEKNIISNFRNGITDKELAYILGHELHTIKNSLGRMRLKTKSSNRVQLCLKLMEGGYISVD